MNQTDINNCKELRKQIFITGYSGGMAHLASCFSSVEIIYSLYIKKILKFDPDDLSWADRDRFVLSKGHAGLALYSTLALAGALSQEELHNYLKPGCHIGGEPNVRDLIGIEASTGSLGHGLSVAVGMAMAQKIDDTNAKTYVLIGDGESEEGTIWEAAMSAEAFGLNNLVAILDCNQIQKVDRVENTLGLVNWADKWKSFGWNVIEVDGHDVDALINAFNSVPQNSHPTMIIANTIKGKGVSIMENNPIWHFKLPSKRELKTFLEELELTEADLEV